MSLKIRFKNHEKIVLIDSRRSRDGRRLKELGYFGLHGVIYVDIEEMLVWLSRGAQPSTSVLRLLDGCGLLSSELQKYLQCK